MFIDFDSIVCASNQADWSKYFVTIPDISNLKHCVKSGISMFPE